MNILRMRAHRRTTLFIVALATMASTALAQPRGKKAPAKGAASGAKGAAPAKGGTPAPGKGSGDGGEIEMNPDDANKPGAGSGDVNPDEIDMGEPEKQQGDLNADLNAA